MLLPIRSRVLHFIATEEVANIDTVMTALKDEYGTERQFTYANFIDHLLSLKENGLLDEEDYELDDQGRLRINYRINEEGLNTVNKYLPQKWRLN
ncbi:DNA-binding PadR family transcriptional regulator [Enterococcus sp. PF1-24]|uniref:hypothetical protein n=1 Tax=unclassified Enterococcus TaxID=2608891 RepID=UPI0024753FCD|nr:MULTISPECIES: hypothetical protein [unclassified Enterococcus]MDH6364095.1 DNA-binding PadR family transcriptional regulator [Enterococcus sp. PFB1-1]MDH6401196.1 DNA-binding PadR family transcriptional regulator [Enterococcus sp. PF1-24]